MEEPDLNEEDYYIDDGYAIERYSAKSYLDTFIFDLYNLFEPSANNDIERLIDELVNIKKSTLTLIKKAQRKNLKRK